MNLKPRFYKSCKRQGCRYLIGPGTAKELKPRTYCSQRCYFKNIPRTQRNSRTRKIMELAAAGKTTPEIAEIVSTTTRWVNWVKVRDRRGSMR
jgi:hypothetical protein